MAVTVRCPIKRPTKVGSLPLMHCFMNASGPICTTKEELEALKHSSYAGAIVTKSATLEPRDGNPEPRWNAVPAGGGIQSMGLPNLGYTTYIKYIKDIKAPMYTHGIHCCPKPVIMSVSGLKLDDNLTMLNDILAVGVENGGADAIELNLSCPNIPGKPQVGYDFDQTRDVLQAVKMLDGIMDRPFGLKLPPYFDDSHFDMMANIIKDMNKSNDQFINFITVINSLGNCLVIDLETEMPIIKPKNGHGGLCGAMVKPVGLSNVRNFRKRLGNEFGIIAAGGVEHGSDAYEYFLVGADAIQVGSQAQKEGPGVFLRISEEFDELLTKKNVWDINVQEIRHRLKFM